MSGKKYRYLKYNNETYSDYLVCDQGQIYSLKSNDLVKLSIRYRPKHSKSPYPTLCISVDGIQKMLLVHIAVCDSWNYKSFPIPEGVSNLEWEQTPNSVKAALRFIYQVNHIDHDPNNHHPSNLEYVTAKKNQQKYQEHRLKMIA